MNIAGSCQISSSKSSQNTLHGGRVVDSWEEYSHLWKGWGFVCTGDRSVVSLKEVEALGNGASARV
jgi:hypothetical protein